MKWNTTIDENNLRTFIDYGEIYNFIEHNQPKENPMTDKEILNTVNSLTDSMYHERGEKLESKRYTDFERIWLTKLFEVHPFLDKIAIVFTD